MPTTVKAPLRPLEYIAWAKSVPRGARFDLTASGMRDTAPPSDGTDASASHPAAAPWQGQLDLAPQCRRDQAEQAIEAFRSRVAERYGLANDCVSLSIGSSLAITQVLIALIRAGDHVIVERPTYEPLHRTPEILGARVSRLERRFEDKWAVVPDRLAQLLTPRTRAVILSNLHNPSGIGIDATRLAEIADLAARVGAMVLVDEVYLDYTFSSARDATHRPAALVAPNCISWSSTTKAFGFSALRAGWIVTQDQSIAKAIRAAADYLHMYMSPTSALLGARVLERADSLVERARSLASAGRRVVSRWLAADPRVSWAEPPAGLTGLVKLPELMTDASFAQHLRDRYETQVVPGSMFEAPGFLRLSYGLDLKELEQALANVTAALDDLT